MEKQFPPPKSSFNNPFFTLYDDFKAAWFKVAFLFLSFYTHYLTDLKE